MKNVYLSFFTALSLFAAEVASAQIFELNIGGNRSNRRNSNRNTEIGFGIQIGPGGVKLNLGLRKDHWKRHRHVFAQRAEQAVIDEPGARLIGYTMIADGGYDYDNVEVRNRENVDLIKIKVLNDGARLDNISVRFCDGNRETQTFTIGQRFAAGQSTQWIDLQGRNRCIDSFSLLGKGDRDGYEATVVLLGMNVPNNDHRNGGFGNNGFGNGRFDRRGHWGKNRDNMYNRVMNTMNNLEPGERVIGFTLLSDDNYDYENVEVRNQEMVDEVRIRVLGDNAFIGNLSIRFCDGGSEQPFSINQKIPGQGLTTWIDLQGRNRCITSFAVNGKGDRGYAESIIVLTGKNRRGNDFPNQGEYPTPMPNPVQIPTQSGPVCEVLGYGSHNGYNYKYRIGVNGQSLEATNSVEDFFNNIAKFQDAGVCYTQPTDCSMSGHGEFGGYNYKYRLKVGDTNFYPTNNLDELIQAMQKLTSRNICYPQASSQCQLIGAGEFGGYNYNYRIGVNGNPIFADNNMDNTLKAMTKLRNSGLCY